MELVKKFVSQKETGLDANAFLETCNYTYIKMWLKVYEDYEYITNCCYQKTSFILTGLINDSINWAIWGVFSKVYM